MSKRMARPTARVLSVVLILALLVLLTGFSSAQSRDVIIFFIEAAKLTAADGAADHFFGYSIAISGDTVVVGAPRDDANGDRSGSAYLFERTEAGWADGTETAKLTASDGAELDNFADSVSISGDTVVVGAPGDNSAYIFEKPETGWIDMTETAKLTASDGTEGDQFGRSVCIAGDSVVVGANGDDDTGSDSGSAYIFQKPETGWIDMNETAKLTASDGAGWDAFGISVSIGGDTVVVGARHDDDLGESSGSVYLFEKPGAGWTDMTEAAKLTASDGAAGDYFGTSISMGGGTLIVGAPYHDDNGSAYLFEKPETGWTDMTETAKLTASDADDGDCFGAAVSISGDIVVAGAYGDDGNGQDSGSVYVLEKPEAGWADMTETAKFVASDGAETDWFGYSVSISGDTIVAGAWGDDDSGSESGSAYLVFRFEPIAWTYLPVVLRSPP